MEKFHKKKDIANKLWIGWVFEIELSISNMYVLIWALDAGLVMCMNIFMEFKLETIWGRTLYDLQQTETDKVGNSLLRSEWIDIRFIQSHGNCFNHSYLIPDAGSRRTGERMVWLDQNEFKLCLWSHQLSPTSNRKRLQEVEPLDIEGHCQFSVQY